MDIALSPQQIRSMEERTCYFKPTMRCYSVPMVVNKLLKIMRLLPRIDTINRIFERIGLQYLSGIYV